MSSTYVSPADTAKYLRAALKAAFPGVKFSVRTSTYSGGASIRVGWTDGPMAAEVDKTAQRYAGATFDGMTDSKDYHRTLIAEGDAVREVRWGADFVFTDRELSPAYAAALAVHAGHVAEQNGYPVFSLDGWYDALGTTWGTFQGGNGHMVVRWLAQHVTPSEAEVKA